MKSAVSALHIVSEHDDNNKRVAAADQSTRTLGALLSAVSSVLRDTLGRFETISGGVTEHVLTRGNAADHDLIVALQDFDRLQQEFAALSNVIAHCARVSSNSEASHDDHAALGHAAIASVTLADLKDRLLTSFRSNTADGPEPIAIDEKEF